MCSWSDTQGRTIRYLGQLRMIFYTKLQRALALSGSEKGCFVDLQLGCLALTGMRAVGMALFRAGIGCQSLGSMPARKLSLPGIGELVAS